MRRLVVRTFAAIWVASALIGASIAAVELAREPTGSTGPERGIERALATDSLPLRTAIVVAVSGLVAFGLARWVTRPIERLRAITHRVADGELGARAAPALGDAATELAQLARDFDAMTARVEALVAARDRLVADVSHELGSPLARQRVAIALARKRLGADAGPALDPIEREAERLGALVREILTLERLGAGVIEPRAIALGELLRGVGEDARFEARERDVEVVVEAPDATIDADPELLRRAIENVARNAIRFAPAGTAVELTLTTAGGAASVTVSDRGPGVPDHELARIFEPMVRLEAHRDPAHPGAGLGLAIAQRAVEAHGGAIRARNRDGGGLEVTLVLTNLHTS